MPNPPAQPDPLSSLLADGAWLKRLAVGLVGESSAEDLAQDVMVSAMRTPPQGTGAQLRAWAKTVARRLAARGGERGRNREHAEQRAARPEASDEASEQRLHLHRRLTDAILALEPAHRTVLVMRFLDDLSPKEIAARLDIAQPTARKRISRALAKLREELDGEFGDRTTWMNAVGPLAFGIGWKDMLPPAAMAPAAATLPPLLALWTMKKLAITSIALCLALWVGFEFLGGEQADLEAPDQTTAQAGLIPTAEPEPETTPNLASAQTTEVRGQAAPILAATSSRLALIILVDGDGAPVPDGVGALVTPDLEVTPLDFDEDGRAELSQGSQGSLCIVRAPGFAIQDFLVEPSKETISVELNRLRTIRGQLLVDGAAPSDELDLKCNWYFSPTIAFRRDDSALMDAGHSAILKSLGLSSGQCSTTTLPGGAFIFDDVQPNCGGHVILPRHLRLVEDEGSSWAAFQYNQDLLDIEATSLHYIKGRLVWDEDGTPYTDAASVGHTNRRNEENTFTKTLPSEYGEFVVPLEFLSANRADGLEDSSIRLLVEGGLQGGGQDFNFAVDGESVVQDVGVLRVNRRLPTTFQVLDALDQPVPDALVESALARGRTDSAGRASIPTAFDGTVLALAIGHGFQSLSLASAVPNEAGHYVICLPAGNDLTITARIEQPALPKAATAFVRIDLPGGLLESRFTWKTSPIGFLSRASRINGDSSRYDWGVRYHFVDVREPIVLPGLKPGTRIKASLHDANGHTLASQVVVIPEDLRPTEMELVPNSGALGHIELEVVGARGQLLPRPVVRGLGKGWAIPMFRGQAGRVEVGPLMPGHYRFQVSALGRAPEEVEVALAPGTHSRQVILYPGRSIAVRFFDSNGIALLPEWVNLTDGDGEVLQGKSSPVIEPVDFANVPMKPLELIAQIGTQAIRQSIGADDSQVEVRLPAMGKIRTHFQVFPSLTGSRGTLTMYIPEEGDKDSAQLARFNSYADGAKGGWDLEASLQPGNYPVIVTFCSDNSAPENTATRTLFEGRVTVVAGEETLIVVTGGSNPQATLSPR